MTGADFFGKNFGKRQTADFGRSERQKIKVTLFQLPQTGRRQRRCFAPADLKFYFETLPS
jgi:hypothetical protein